MVVPVPILMLSLVQGVFDTPEFRLRIVDAAGAVHELRSPVSYALQSCEDFGVREKVCLQLQPHPDYLIAWSLQQVGALRCAPASCAMRLGTGSDTLVVRGELRTFFRGLTADGEVMVKETELRDLSVIGTPPPEDQWAGGDVVRGEILLADGTRLSLDTIHAVYHDRGAVAVNNIVAGSSTRTTLQSALYVRTDAGQRRFVEFTALASMRMLPGRQARLSARDGRTTTVDIPWPDPDRELAGFAGVGHGGRVFVPVWRVQEIRFP
jgi:hypothetical protein